jgi:hypothetical protein
MSGFEIEPYVQHIGMMQVPVLRMKCDKAGYLDKRGCNMCHKLRTLGLTCFTEASRVCDRCDASNKRTRWGQAPTLCMLEDEEAAAICRIGKRVVL